MAIEQYRFFDTVTSDTRKYRSDEFAEYFRMFLTDGIKNGGDNLRVTADSAGMYILTDYGFAMIQGYGYWIKDDGKGKFKLQIPATQTKARIDRIVLRLNKNSGYRNISVVVLQGAEAALPVPPTLTRSGNIYELSLARVNVKSNAAVITTADITDERLDPAVCGLINSLIALDPKDFVSRFEAMLQDMESLQAKELIKILGNSPAEFLNLLKTVDGQGSGLDADLVRGKRVPVIYSGTAEPDNSLGEDGDIYVMY